MELVPSVLGGKKQEAQQLRHSKRSLIEEEIESNRHKKRKLEKTIADLMATADNYAKKTRAANEITYTLWIRSSKNCERKNAEGSSAIAKWFRLCYCWKTSNAFLRYYLVCASWCVIMVMCDWRQITSVWSRCMPFFFFTIKWAISLLKLFSVEATKHIAWGTWNYCRGLESPWKH